MGRKKKETKEKEIPVPKAEVKPNTAKAGTDNSDWTGKKVYTPFGVCPVIEDLGDRATVQYADGSRKIYLKSGIKIV